MPACVLIDFTQAMVFQNDQGSVVHTVHQAHWFGLNQTFFKHELFPNNSSLLISN